MNADRHNFEFQDAVRPVEPLPIDFEPALSDVDRLLSRSAQAPARDMPAGLSQRVYEMSVASLPAAEAERPALKLVESGESSFVLVQRSSHFSWRRLALAASVLLVAGVTLWTSWPRTPIGPSGGNAGGGTGATPPSVRTASIDFGELNRIAASNPSDIDAFESEVTYLLDASEVRSFKDLNNDLRQFVAQLEM